MRQYVQYYLILTGLILGFSFLVGAAGAADVPIYFIKNNGQENQKAEFYARTPGYTVWLTKTGLVFDRRVREPNDNKSHGKSHGKNHREITRLTFNDSNKEPQLVPLRITDHRVHYLKNKSKPITPEIALHRVFNRIETFEAVLYKSVYPNIDLKVYANKGRVEYDWIVNQGGNPENIVFTYRSQTIKGGPTGPTTINNDLHLDQKGNLAMITPAGGLIQQAPLAYQETKTGKQEIPARFHLQKKPNRFAFQLEAYNRNLPLIIDPIVMSFSTYLGAGTDGSNGSGITMDAAGNTYVTGSVSGDGFPTYASMQNTNNGERDIYIAKLSATDGSLVFSTYLGGGGNDYSQGIAVDAAGNMYITGFTDSDDFPVQNSYQQTPGGSTDAVAVKVAADGSSLIYSTYLGGNAGDRGRDIAVNSLGQAYIAGDTLSSDFPMKNAYMSSFSGKPNAFAAKLTAAGNALLYSTYLGGNGGTRTTGAALDGSGNFYVTGSTSATNFPTASAHQWAFGGGASDMFVTKFSAAGTSLLYSTYLGGGGQDVSEAITVDASGNAYVAGYTTSSDFPTANAYQSKLYGDQDAVALRLNASGNDLIYSTFLGGTESAETATAATVDGTGALYVAGYTDSPDFPVKNPYQQEKVSTSDMFIARLAPAGNSLDFSTYLGGGGNESPAALFVNGAGVTITGKTSSKNFPTENGVETHYSGGTSLTDTVAFVSKFRYLTPLPPAPPFGTFETPKDNASVSGSIVVSGWALDNGEVPTVEISVDNPTGSGRIYIGDALFVSGARPDVQGSYPDYPFNNKAGWGYMMLTHFLPNGGNGTYKVHATATDSAGNETALGSKTILVDNKNAVKPFGAIDTPAPGETVSGTSYSNIGWALTPQPNNIPEDGATITVFIDNQPVGHPTYNLYRKDIEQLFPGYANTQGAMGVFKLDTTTFANGVHSIAWAVVDSAGNVDGIGSRYFVIKN